MNYNPMNNPYRNLTRSEVRALSKELRAAGFRLPKVGMCITLGKGRHGERRELCHDARGYFRVGDWR